MTENLPMYNFEWVGEDELSFSLKIFGISKKPINKRTSKLSIGTRTTPRHRKHDIPLLKRNMADQEKVIKYSTSPEENWNSPNGSILKLEDLPNELILKVLCFLETIDLICCSQLSKRIRAISHDESLWQKMNLYVNGCAFRAKFKHIS